MNFSIRFILQYLNIYLQSRWVGKTDRGRVVLGIMTGGPLNSLSFFLFFSVLLFHVFFSFLWWKVMIGYISSVRGVVFTIT